jgi:hypothetical protein
MCTSYGDFQSGLCAGFVAGIADAALGTSHGILGRRACLPEQVTGAQARDVVKQFLEQHPEARHYAAARLVLDALAEALPRKR